MIEARGRPPWNSGGLAITESEFYSALGRSDPSIADILPRFFERCAEFGLTVERADSAFVIYWVDEDAGRVKFGTFFKNGIVDTNHICAMAREAGDRIIGEDYLDGIAALIGGASADKSGNDLTWRVMKDGRLPKIADFLAVSEEWLDLIKVSVGKFRSVCRPSK